MLFGCLQAVGAEEARMAIESFQSAIHSIVSIIGPMMAGPGEKSYIIKVFRWLENTISILIFTNTVNNS